MSKGVGDDVIKRFDCFLFCEQEQEIILWEILHGVPLELFSSQRSTTGVIKAMDCTILSVEWCIKNITYY